MPLPIDQLSEIIYSLLILLIFIQAYWLLTRDGQTADFVSSDYAIELFFAALGAILAWGIIDGMMYILLSMFDRSERRQLLYTIQSAPTDEDAIEIIAEEFDYMFEPIVGERERQRLYINVLAQLRNSQPRAIGFKRSDWIEAGGLVLTAVLAVLPSLAPFLFLRHNFALALTVSSIISLSILFVAGYAWGKYTGTNAWKTGLLTLVVGVCMVVVALLLGG
jgi:hypothetical protein